MSEGVAVGIAKNQSSAPLGQQVLAYPTGRATIYMRQRVISGSCKSDDSMRSPVVVAAHAECGF